jgi:hypothetical protein
VPKVSEFFGIAIYMYYDDHGPPHFHALYAGRDAAFDIETLEVLFGQASPRVRRLVVEWAKQHRDELVDRWNKARAKGPLEWIAPLE